MGNKTNHAEPMDPEEVLRRAEAFAPTPKPNREGIMRLALQMIVQRGTKSADEGESDNQWCRGFDYACAELSRIAEQALRECGK
jgi:hypothetical protein